MAEKAAKAVACLEAEVRRGEELERAAIEAEEEARRAEEDAVAAVETEARAALEAATAAAARLAAEAVADDANEGDEAALVLVQVSAEDDHTSQTAAAVVAEAEAESARMAEKAAKAVACLEAEVRRGEELEQAAIEAAVAMADKASTASIVAPRMTDKKPELAADVGPLTADTAFDEVAARSAAAAPSAIALAPQVPEALPSPSPVANAISTGQKAVESPAASVTPVALNAEAGISTPTSGCRSSTRLLSGCGNGRPPDDEPGTGSKSFRPFSFRLGQYGFHSLFGCLLCGLCRTFDDADDVEAPNRPMLLLPSEFDVENTKYDGDERDEVTIEPVCAKPAEVLPAAASSAEDPQGQ